MVFKKLPKKVRVKKSTYEIRYPKTLRKGELAGMCDWGDKKIDIALDQGRPESESTIIHEILHAISHEHGFPLSEKKVLILEQALYEVFRANNWMIAERPKKKN